MDPDVKKTSVWVALGGAIGALLRHLTNLAFSQFQFQSHLLTATSFENVFGSFLMGYFYSLFTRKKSPDKLRQFMLIGMIGSYTTYSGFGLEAMQLFGESPLIFSGYIFSQVFIGLIALIAGLKLGKKF